MKYLIIFSFFTTTLYGQGSLGIPSLPEFSTYLQARQDSIETRLYRLAVAGTIRAYRTDSLASSFPSKIAASRGSWKRYDTSNARYLYKYNKDSSRILGYIPNPKFDQHKWDTLENIPFSPANIFNIYFVEESKGNAFKPEGTVSLKGIALATSTVYENPDQGYYFPLFWASYKDISRHLVREDLEFLGLLYFYARNSRCVNSYRNPNDVIDAFWELNNLQQVVIKPDSLFYRQVASMLRNSEFYLDEVLYPGDLSHESYEMDEVKPNSRFKRIIYDEQQKKYINILEYKKAYWKMQGVSVTDTTNPGEYVDSFYKVPIPIYGLDSLVYDTHSLKITKYCFVLYHEENGVRMNPFNLYIDTSINQNCANVKPIIWFYEDYIRWKLHKHIN